MFVIMIPCIGTSANRSYRWIINISMYRIEWIFVNGSFSIDENFIFISQQSPSALRARFISSACQTVIYLMFQMADANAHSIKLYYWGKVNEKIEKSKSTAMCTLEREIAEMKSVLNQSCHNVESLRRRR